MHVPLVASGRLRREAVGRQAADEVGGDLDGVDHPSLGIAGMGVEALEGHRHRVGAEALDLELAARLAVHRVGAVGAELRDVEVLRAATDLLVGGEADPDRAVRDLRVAHQPVRRGHHLGDAGLVVGAEQRRAGGGDDRAPDLLGERRVVGEAEDGGRIVGQDEILPPVVGVDDRFHPGARHLGRGVDVGEEADRRHVRLLRRGGNRRHDVPPLVDRRVGEADRLQLVDQQAEQLELLRGRRVGGRRLVGLSVDPDIAEEALEDLLADVAHGRKESLPGRSRIPLRGAAGEARRSRAHFRPGRGACSGARRRARSECRRGTAHRTRGPLRRAGRRS